MLSSLPTADPSRRPPKLYQWPGTTEPVQRWRMGHWSMVARTSVVASASCPRRLCKTAGLPRSTRIECLKTKQNGKNGGRVGIVGSRQRRRSVVKTAIPAKAKEQIEGRRIHRRPRSIPRSFATSHDDTRATGVGVLSNVFLHLHPAEDQP